MASNHSQYTKSFKNIDFYQSIMFRNIHRHIHFYILINQIND